MRNSRLQLKSRSKAKEQPIRIKPRVVLCMLPLLVFFTVLLGRAAWLQFGDDQRLESRIGRTLPKQIKIAQNNRGIIYDRNGKPLAVNVPVKSAYFDPMLAKQQDGYYLKINKIASQLGLDRKRLTKRFDRAKRFLWIKRHLTPNEYKQLEALDMHGLHFVEENKRFYPNGPLAAPILGFTNRDGKGIEGVEYTADRWLTGSTGIIRGQRDAKGRKLLIGGIKQKLQAGDDLYLTIDAVLQHILERELATAVDNNQAVGATGVILQPRTGEILAMANMPSFDANNYQDYPRRIWKNRAVTDIFEPGSTFKAFVVAHAIEKRLVDNDEQFYCKPGSLSIRSRTIQEAPHKDWLTPTEILKVSSNIGAAKIGLLLGQKEMHQLIERFGFDQKTGVELPGEAPGLIRNPRSWTDYDLASAAFGQGIGVTALQLTSAFASIVNDGFLVTPHLFKRIGDNENPSKDKLTPVKTISSVTSKELREMLTSVVTREGTGEKASIAGYTVGGKTGTAQRFDSEANQYPDEEYVSSFVGFFPYEDPQLVIFVMIDRPQGKFRGGGAVAAPVFQHIAKQAADYLEIKPKQPLPTNLPKKSGGSAKLAHKQKARGGRDYRGLTMREVLSLAKQQNIKVVVRGSGFATGVTEIIKDHPQVVKVYFSPSTIRTASDNSRTVEKQTKLVDHAN